MNVLTKILYLPLGYINRGELLQAPYDFLEPMQTKILIRPIFYGDSR